MGKSSSKTIVGRSRAGTAELLKNTVAMTKDLERWLDVHGGWSEATAQIDLDADPTATLRIQGALLLRKARVHTVAALRANETSNLHSLAVQMRPVLESAGQVVFVFHNTIIAPGFTATRESARDSIGHRLNADHYQTLLRETKGQIRPEELRRVEEEAERAAAASVGMPAPKKRKGRSFKHSDKVAMLPYGREWYAHLSEHFGHGKREWRGLSMSGGVISIDTAADQLAFLWMLNYLVNQVALMNAYTALCPIAGDNKRSWINPTLAHLSEVRAASKTLLDDATSAWEQT